MSWTAWLSIAVVALAAAEQLAAAMPRVPSQERSLRVGFGHKDLKHKLQHHRYSSTYDPSYRKDECMSQSLSCVPKDDCTTKTKGQYEEGRVCPINFVAHDSLCVFLPTKKKVEQRTQAQVVDYCSRLRTRPYYFQNAKEWSDFYGFLDQSSPEYNDFYMLDARWEKDHDRWEWLSTGEEIEWEKLLHQANCLKENREVVEREDGCLAVSLDRKSQCLRLRQIGCTDTALCFTCKDGSYESRCGQSENSLCCATPTYSYYSRNKHGGPGSHVHGQSKRNCWVKVDEPDTKSVKSVPCHNALDILGFLKPYPQPVRVGTSFYYFSHNPCRRVSRQAVISRVQVHDFIVSYLLTEELVVQSQSFVIGLRYDPDDDEFFWENGKVIHYYNNKTFWAEGQPDKQSGSSKSSCVAYRRSGKNSYAWHFLPSERCFGPAVINVCEIPIRTTKLVPSAKKKECGQRFSRGVLARSSRSDVLYDDDLDEEANYGEFPWHVAVLKQRNYGGQLEFACSGVLIDPEFVLTSAHCIIYSGSTDLSVSLGEWDLNGDSEVIFASKVVAVNEAIYPKSKANKIRSDWALLQLKVEVDVDSFPHIGLGCLPYHSLFYESSGKWDCYTVGWPSQERRDGDQRILQRIESKFISNRLCDRYTRRQHDYIQEYHRDTTGFDKEDEALGYEKHDYFEDSYHDLVCTEPYQSHSCLDDNTPILVCKPASSYIGDLPFGNSYNGPREHYSDNHGPGNKHRGPDDHHKDHGDHSSRLFGNTLTNHLWNTRIVNAFGEDRFDSNKWYVMGIGHEANTCNQYYPPKQGDYHHPHHRDAYQVFTPVPNFLSFIHNHLEPR